MRSASTSPTIRSASSKNSQLSNTARCASAIDPSATPRAGTGLAACSGTTSPADGEVRPPRPRPLLHAVEQQRGTQESVRIEPSDGRGLRGLVFVIPLLILVVQPALVDENGSDSQGVANVRPAGVRHLACHCEGQYSQAHLLVSRNGLAHFGGAQCDFFGNPCTRSSPLVGAHNLSVPFVFRSRHELSGVVNSLAPCDSPRSM